MDMDILRRLEQRVDQLLERVRDLDAHCSALQAEKDRLLEEREAFCQELDRILVKLEPQQEQER